MPLLLPIFTDYHSAPFTTKKKKITRPIIIKFVNIFDKYQFTQNLKNLKAYNVERKAKRLTASYAYATEHLPKELQKQKKALMPLFQKAKRNKQKTAWKLQDSEYCLFVDDQRVELPDKKSTRRSDQISSEQSNCDSSDEEK